MSAEHAQAYVRPRLLQKSNCDTVHMVQNVHKKEVPRGLPFCVRFLLYAHLQKRSVQALQKAESVLQRRKLLQGILFYHCISMLQQKSLGSQREGFLSAILGKDVADFVKFFRFAAGLVQNELVS